ncbi:iron ABC transporter permease, partial [Acinetobacter baumannii]
MQNLKYYWFYPLPVVMIFISLLIGPTQTLSAWDYLRWGVLAVFGTPYFDAEQFRL